MEIARRSGSPPAVDSGKIAFVSSRDGNPEIYTINTDGTDLTRLTYDSAIDEEPAWSPDGQRIAFVSDRSGSYELYVMNPNGSDVFRRTFSASYTQSPSWSPDGTKIAYSTMSNGSANLWVVSPNAGGPGPTLLFEAPGWDAQPSWSPDGTKLALVSDWYAYDFVYDIFLINADGSGFTGLTGNIFDNLDYLGPSWSPNGATIAHVLITRLAIDQYITTLAVMNADGTGRRPLISACSECGAVISFNKLAKSSWSPDGQVIAFTSGTTNALNVSWVEADGSASGLIVSNGWSPAWRPVVTGVPCAPAANNLCLLGNRFQVTLQAKDPRTGRTGIGQAVPQSDRFGYFSLPDFTGDPTFPEVLVKMVDATASPGGSFWVFYGGLTDLHYTMTVTDTLTGEVRSYRNDPANPTCGGADTSAFKNIDASGQQLTAGDAGAATSLAAGEGTELALMGNRFRVSLSAVDPRTGSTAVGQAMPQGDRFGYFSLPDFTGDPTFPEVFVKMADSLSGVYWVFHTGLTDLQYTMTVTDTATGAVRIYQNDRGDPFRLCGGIDTFSDWDY